MAPRDARGQDRENLADSRTSTFVAAQRTQSVPQSEQDRPGSVPRTPPKPRSVPFSRLHGPAAHAEGSLTTMLVCECCGRRCAAYAMSLRNAKHLCGACSTTSARADDGARRRPTITHWPLDREIPRLAGRRPGVARDVARVDAAIFGILLVLRIGVYGLLASFATHLPPAQAFLAGLLLGDLLSWPVRTWLNYRDGEPLTLTTDAVTYTLSIACWLLAGHGLDFAADSASQSSGWLGTVTGFYASGIANRLERARSGIF